MLNTIYYIFAITMTIVMVKSLKTYFDDGAKERFDFLVRAHENGHRAHGKLTCLTREGKKSESHYCAEYMYVVDGKRYFVTYEINPNIMTKNGSKNEVTGDILALDIMKYPTLYYSARFPEIVYCKADIFTSYEAMHQIKTVKNNIYRDVDKDWTTPIDLTVY